MRCSTPSKLRSHTHRFEAHRDSKPLLSREAKAQSLAISRDTATQAAGLEGFREPKLPISLGTLRHMLLIYPKTPTQSIGPREKMPAKVAALQASPDPIAVDLEGHSHHSRRSGTIQSAIAPLPDRSSDSKPLTSTHTETKNR
jgi:hypothetical protein